MNSNYFLYSNTVNFLIQGNGTTNSIGISRKKVAPDTLNVKLPTPVTNNHATATALAAGNNHIDLFEDDDDLDHDADSISDEYISSLKLNVLIGLVVLLVVTCVGTAMLLSISKIWGNHQENVWIENQMADPDNYLEVFSRERNQYLHPKDLSSFLFQYEVARRQEEKKQKKKGKIVQIHNQTIKIKVNEKKEDR